MQIYDPRLNPAGSAGKVIYGRDRRCVKLLTDPKSEPSPWPNCLDGEGRWTALANVDGTLCYIELTLHWQEYTHA